MRDKDHLGVTVTPSNYVDPPWFQEGGATVFETFHVDTAASRARKAPSAIVAELERHAEVLGAQQLHRSLEIILGR